MGFLVITESMSFVPADYGINKNTSVTAILVGSGAGGSSAKNSSGTVYAAGGASGCGGVGTKDSTFSTISGGGFGAGGGGGAYKDGKLAGNGGGAGEIVIKNIVFSNPSTAVTITVGQRVSADTPGEATSIGNYATASGGKVGAGGKGRNNATYYGGGSSGGGGVGRSSSKAGTGGSYGGGAGGYAHGNNGIVHGEDGYCYAGESGKGVVLLFW